MTLNEALQLLLSVVGAVVATGWIYVVWCIGQIVKSYRLRADAAAIEVEFYGKRLERIRPLLETWEKSVDRIQRQLATTEARLGETSQDRDELRKRVSDLQNSLCHLRNSDDPIANLFPRDIADWPY